MERKHYSARGQPNKLKRDDGKLYSIFNDEYMERAAKLTGDNHGCAVLLKGGHSINDANDLFYANGEYKWFYGKRIDNPNTHGTGCALSSAIASNLAKGYNLESSIQRAKDYISGALAAMLDLGQGSGPMNHAFDMNGKYPLKDTEITCGYQYGVSNEVISGQTAKVSVR